MLPLLTCQKRQRNKTKWKCFAAGENKGEDIPFLPNELRDNFIFLVPKIVMKILTILSLFTEEEIWVNSNHITRWKTRVYTVSLTGLISVTGHWPVRMIQHDQGKIVFHEAPKQFEEDLFWFYKMYKTRKIIKQLISLVLLHIRSALDNFLGSGFWNRLQFWNRVTRQDRDHRKPCEKHSVGQGVQHVKNIIWASNFARVYPGNTWYEDYQALFCWMSLSLHAQHAIKRNSFPGKVRNDTK